MCYPVSINNCIIFVGPFVNYWVTAVESYHRSYNFKNKIVGSAGVGWVVVFPGTIYSNFINRKNCLLQLHMTATGVKARA